MMTWHYDTLATEILRQQEKAEALIEEQRKRVKEEQERYGLGEAESWVLPEYVEQVAYLRGLRDMYKLFDGFI
jgi:hypothetical protein